MYTSQSSEQMYYSTRCQNSESYNFSNTRSENPEILRYILTRRIRDFMEHKERKLWLAV